MATPPPVTEIKPGLPRDLARIIRRCLAKDPEDRYQTAKDLRNDLRGLGEDLRSGDQAAAAEAPARFRRSLRPALVVAAAIVLAGGAFIGWRVSRGGSREAANDSGARPFASLGLTRLTTTGTAGLAALSPDGRYVAHVVTAEQGQGLWLRQVATSSNVEIVPPDQVRFTGLAFSPDGNYVLYVIYPTGQTFGSMFQVPVLGGAARQLVYDIDSAPAFSPDSARFAFVRGFTGATAIMVANADGSGVHELVRRTAPQGFQIGLQSVAWSPDGAVLAVAGTDQTTLTTRLGIVDAASGVERPLGDTEWRLARGLAWLPDGSGLLVNAQEAGGESTISQLWEVSYPAGVDRRITTDLSSYSGLSLSGDGRTLVTVRGEERSSIWVSDDVSAGAFRMVSTSAGADDGVQGLAWAMDGRLLYTSTASGNSDIWIMNADGRRIQLTTDRADDRIPSPTPDGRYVVFMSERGGARGIWRMTRRRQQSDPAWRRRAQQLAVGAVSLARRQLGDLHEPAVGQSEDADRGWDADVRLQHP